MLNRLLDRSRPDEGTEWLSISDMMTGLMVIFLFIAISYMINIRDVHTKTMEVAETYSRLHEELYADLLAEFENDLDRWSADIERETLSITFHEPEVLFQSASAEIQPKFREILNVFFPRYVGILRGEKYIEEISEVRIEGHTSSDWSSEPIETAYFFNMGLSQERTRSVLMYVMPLFDDPQVRAWLRSNFTANGLSSSRVRLRADGSEDLERSRRVEFRVRTNADERMAEIIRIGEQ